MSRLPNYSIVTRNGRIVWKHWPNGLLYALMLRIKLYQNPFFSTVHQNINKQKIKAVTTVFELPCYFPMWLKSRFFLSSIEIQICEDQTLSKRLPLIQEANYIKFRIEVQTSRSYFFTSLLGASYTMRDFKYYRAD